MPEHNETNAENMFEKRVSIELNPNNAKFFRSEGGLISLTLTADGKTETFERVVVIRSFPITNPDEYISVREPDTRQKGRGEELGLIVSLSDFDSETVALLNDELARRYFTPVITKIQSMKEKYGYTYCEADTSAGHASFVLNNPSNNIRTLEDGRVLITDTDGNRYTLPDPKKLDKASYRKIEIYL